MKRPIKIFLIIAITISIVLAIFLQAGVFGLWQLKASDTLYGGTQPLNNIVIIAIDDKSLQELGRWPWDRTYYAALLEQIRISKIIGFDVSFFESSTQQKDEILGEALRNAGNTIIPTEFIEFDRENGKLVGKELLRPIPELENITTGIVNVFTDADGVSRSVPVRVNEEPSFAFVLAEKFIGRTPGFNEQRMLINFGKPSSYTTYSFTDVLNKQIPSEEFKDKIVIIGATAPDLRDDYIVPTSWGKRMPGVEIHANSLQTILTKKFVRYQSFENTLFWILILSLAVSLLFWRFSELKASIGAAILLIIVFASAFMLYNRGTIVNLIYQPLAVIITSVLCIIYIARSEKKHKDHILSVFGKYVSKDVVTHLLKSDAALELGGQEREISALFVDIRGFTAISEKLKPRQVINFLNHYFGAMTDTVFKNNGTLDKFIGDSIMAVFNSPHDEPNHAFKAVKTALEMQEACQKLQKEGLPKIQIGIGVNTGKAIVGNMGSGQRQEFTAIGDTVNTASRLCSAAVGGQVIISDSTYQQIKGRVVANKLPLLKVKGKQKELVVYEVLKLK